MLAALVGHGGAQPTGADPSFRSSWPRAAYLLFILAAADRLPARPDRDARSRELGVHRSDQFAAQFGLWWIIWPAILLGIVVGILPGFSPQNTLIMLLPLTLAVPVEQALRLHDRAVLREPPRRRHSGDPGEDPRLGRRGGDHARRLPDDAEGPGAAGAGAVLHRLGVRRADHHARHARAAAVAVAARPVPALGRDGGGDALRPHADRGDRRQGHAEGR